LVAWQASFNLRAAWMQFAPADQSSRPAFQIPKEAKNPLEASIIPIFPLLYNPGLHFSYFHYCITGNTNELGTGEEPPYFRQFSLDMNHILNYYGSLNNSFHRRDVMKSITIHGIDPDLESKISEKSAEYGLSQNRTVKKLLQKTLQPDQKASRRAMFSDLFGKWSSAEKSAFEKHTADFEIIDESDQD